MIYLTLIGFIMTGCVKKNSNQQTIETALTIDHSEAIEDNKEDNKKEEVSNQETPKRKLIQEQYELLGEIDIVNEWSNELLEVGSSSKDINQDNIDDIVSIQKAEQENGRNTAKFEIMISGMIEPFIIKDYPTYLKEIIQTDIDLDNKEEILVIFDGGSQGGQGTLAVFLIQDGEEEFEVILLTNTAMNGTGDFSGKEIKETSLNIRKEELGIEEEWTIDEICNIDKILYQGKERILTSQYIWSGSHSNEKGIIKSIVSYQDDQFLAEEIWFEESMNQ